MHFELTTDDGKPFITLKVDFTKGKFSLRCGYQIRERRNLKTRAGLIWAVDNAFAELLSATFNHNDQPREVEMQSVGLANLRELFGLLTFTRHWDSPDIATPAEKSVRRVSRVTID